MLVLLLLRKPCFCGRNSIKRGSRRSQVSGKREAGAYSEEGEGGEGLRSRQLVAQEDIDAEGEHRHQDGDGVEREAKKSLDDEGAP